MATFVRERPEPAREAITFSLGRLPGEDVILTGPSIFGLADPGHATAIALLQVTTTLLMRRPGLHALVTVGAMGHLVDEIGQEFLAAAKALEARARAQATSTPPEGQSPPAAPS